MSWKAGANLIYKARKAQVGTDTEAAQLAEAEHAAGELAEAAAAYMLAGDAFGSAARWSAVTAVEDPQDDDRANAEFAERDPLGWYLGRDADGELKVPDCWPFVPELFKPEPNAQANYAVAGAYLAAEIDRLNRLAKAAGIRAAELFGCAD